MLEMLGHDTSTMGRSTIARKIKKVLEDYPEYIKEYPEGGKGPGRCYKRSAVKDVADRVMRPLITAA